MVSGPYWNPKKGTYSLQFRDQEGWHRVIVYRIRGWKEGKPKPRGTPAEVDRARVRYAEIEAEAKDLRASGLPGSLSDFLGAHVASYHKPGTRRSVRNAAATFVDWCATQDIEKFLQVNEDVCLRWMDAMLANDLKVSTLKTRRAHLAAAWQKVSVRKKIPNPWSNARVPGKVEIKRRGSWTVEQIELILAHSKPWLQKLVIFGINTGLRINALINLEWRDIELPKTTAKGWGNIRVRPELDKAAKGYTVPISPKLHTLIIKMDLERKGDTVILNEQGNRIRWVNQTRRAIMKACADAGLPTPDSPNHHLRRSFGRLAHSGELFGKSVPLYYVQRWLGHAKSDMTMKYLDISEDDGFQFMVDEPDRP